MSRMMRALRLVLKLGRLKMTVFSAVTYATAASLIEPADFNATRFLAGWAFVFFTQLVAHFLGEYYDLPSDKLNCYAGPLTGGSKVLLSGDVTPEQCFVLGYACFAAAGTILAYALPRRCWLIGTALLFIAHQYSGPPFKWNHRGLGELSASVATNVLLPQFAVLVQSASFGVSTPLLGFHRILAVLVVPAFFLKVGLFLALNMADRRPDWLGGKYTLPVLLGEETCARMLAACTVAAYASSICVYFLGLCPATTLSAILLSAPEGLSIARAFTPSLTLPKLQGGSIHNSEASGGRSDAQRPYRLEKLVVRILKHAPCVVLAVFADAMVREAVAAGSAAVAAAQGGSYWGNWLSGVVGTMVLAPAAVRYLPLAPFIYMFFVAKPPPRPPPPSSSASDASSISTATPPASERSCGVVVSGGGVGGLVLGACLQQLGLPFEILEKSLSRDSAHGADLALWPAATKVLKELGVGATGSDASDFWERNTYPVGLVRICKVDKQSDQAVPPPPPLPLPPVSASTPGGGDGGVRLTAAPETILTEVDMNVVVDGEGEPFRLVGRQAVMSSLAPLVEERNIRRGIRVLRVEQSFPPGDMVATAHLVGARGGGGSAAPVEAYSGAPIGSPVEERITCRVLVGADGIHSVCRPEVHAATASLSASRHAEGGGALPRGRDRSAAASRGAGPRDGGEVCYRGVLDLKDGSPAAGLRSLFEDDEEKRPGSMSVVYGDRIRFSWGFIDGARETGYWFVKQLTVKREGGGEDGGGAQNEPLGDKWPEPLRTFARMTGEECAYAHQIQDRPSLDRWSCGNITLLGDACHPATPNNGQGACMAIEDALVLATLLGEYWEKRDGHVEAFYLYERARLAHTRSVQRESLKQMKLGQLTSRVGIWVREKIIRALPPSVLQKKLRAANVYDIDSWLDRFRALKAKQGQRGDRRAS